MQLHILCATESLCGYFQQPGFYWVCICPTKKRVLRWRGPFTSKAECIASAGNANPTQTNPRWRSAPEATV